MKILLQDIPQGHSIIERREPASGLEIEAWCRPQGPLEVALDVVPELPGDEEIASQVFARSKSC